MGRVLSVNVGLPRDVAWNGKSVRTGVWKLPVEGRRMVRRLNIDGDGQGDLEGHGGVNRAVFVYQMESYRYWEGVLGRKDFTYGQFGENFTVEGLADDEVCIGDQFRVGGAVFEVSQPRVTCYRVGIRMNEPRMASLLVAHRRPGFYFRVIEEGEVGAGDTIEKIGEGAERMTVAEVDGLLYLPGHTRGQVEKALRIPALSKGWQSSFEAILKQESSGGGAAAGNAGLAKEEAAPAWPGFRRMRVAGVRKESGSVSSLKLEASDGGALPLAQPGQFVVLRLQVEAGKPAVVRSYSLSDLPAADHFRISVKSEGTGSGYLCTHVREGDTLEVSAPRGSFTLRAGETPVALLSAGIGATPVMAMLHQLAAERSEREVWWIYGARDGASHPFAEESKTLVGRLPRGRRYIAYSRPGAGDAAGVNFDGPGRVDVPLLERLGVPRDADFYLCGPAAFLEGMRAGLASWGAAAERVHAETFGGLGGFTPGIAETAHKPHSPEGEPGTGPMVSFARSGVSAAWSGRFGSLLEMAEACDVPVRWACRTGVCHTCMTGLIGGTVRYAPEPLERPAAGNVLVCCSQPEANVILDL